MKALVLAVAASSAVVLSGPRAAAETLDAVTADQLERILEEAGLNPTMIPSRDGGFPVAYGDAGASKNFYVRGFSCSGQPLACQELMFFAEFELGRDETPGDYRIVNGFNDQQVFGRAFVLPKVDKVGVDYVIELGGGVSEKHLTENVGRWADVLAEFLTTFQAGEPIG